MIFRSRLLVHVLRLLVFWMWCYQTEIAHALTVTSNPTNLAGGVPLGVRPILSFNEALNSGTINSQNISLKMTGSRVSVTISVSYKSGESSVTVIPEGDLFPGLDYTLELNPNIKGVSGSTLGQSYSFKFTTGFNPWHAGGYILTSMDTLLKGTESYLNNTNSQYFGGVALRMTWSEFEGEWEGQFDWSTLDTNLSIINSVGKKASLAIFSSTSRSPLPSWLTGYQGFYSIDENENHPTYGDCIKFPIPWDSVFRQKYLNFIDKLGKHLQDNPALNSVISYVNGSGDAVTVNWAYGGMLKKVYNQSDCSAPSATTWAALGFNSGNLISELKVHIDAFFRAFPDKTQWFSVGDTKLEDPLGCGDKVCVAKEAAQYGKERYPDRFGIWREDLSGKRSNLAPPKSGGLWEMISPYRPKIGAQMVWNVQDCPGDGVKTKCRMGGLGTAKDVAMRNAIQIGSSNDKLTGDGYYLMPYQEIYSADVSDLSLTQVFSDAKNLIRWQSDLTPPSAPSGTNVGFVTETSASLIWDLSSDLWDKITADTNDLAPAPSSDAYTLGRIAYHVFRDGVLVARTEQNNYLDSTLSEGRTYQYTIQAVDASGNISTANSFALVQTPIPDRTPPTLAIVSPASNFAVQGQLTLQASVSDNVGVSGVQFYLDGQGLGSELVLSPYLLVLDTTALSEGFHTVSAKGRDAAGNLGQSDTVSFIVDRTPPAQSEILVTAMTTTATLSWTTDESATSEVEYGSSINYGNQTSPETQFASTHIASLTGLQQGTFYHFRVRSTDAAGNQAVSNDLLFMTVDDIAPSANLTAPGNNQTVTGVVSVTAEASDNVGVTSVQVQLDGVNLGTSMASPPYAVSLDTIGLVEGSVHTLTAIAQDAWGNQSTSTPITITVRNDFVAPSLSSIGATGITSTAVTIAWNTDEPSDSQIEYGKEGYESLSALDASLVTSHSVTLGGLLEATTYHFRVNSKDRVGNLSQSSDLTFTTSDVTAPTITISSPLNYAIVSNVITISVEASDNVGVRTVQFKVDGTFLGSDSTTPYSKAWDSRTIPNGFHTVTATARDAAGNTRQFVIYVEVRN